jgi:prepilin-type N-terminal cleavage/methylation domain-containing protein
MKKNIKHVFKDSRAFTLLEMLIVMLILLILFYMIHQLFWQTSHKVSEKSQESVFYAQQVDLYQKLLEDISSAPFSIKNNFLSNNIRLQEGERFSFIKEGGIFFEKWPEIDHDLHAEDEGFYRVEYRVFEDVLERILLPLSTSIPENEQGGFDYLLRETIVFPLVPEAKVTSMTVRLNGQKDIPKEKLKTIDVIIKYHDGVKEHAFLHKFQV